MDVEQDLSNLDAIRTVELVEHGSGGTVRRSDQIVVEEPLEVRVDGTALAVVMRTPGADLELAAGFLHAEAIVRVPDDIGTIAYCTNPESPDLRNVINVRLAEGAPRVELEKKRATRTTVTSSSCGVCGKESIESLQIYAPPFPRTTPLKPALLVTLPEQLSKAQRVFGKTGGLHAAGLFDSSGALVVLREDVGRHNAVDKCIGHLLLTERWPTRDLILVVSGRTSFEIVQKALLARVQHIVAVSAPSSLAIDLARASNMTLIGFARGDRFNVYSGEA